MTVDISELELPRPPPRSFDFYFVLIFMVAPVYLLVPASWGFVLYTTATASYQTYSWKYRILYAIALFEVLFNIYYTILARLYGGPSTSPIRTVEEIHLTFSRVLKAGLPGEIFGDNNEDIIQLNPDDPRAADFRNSFRLWFHNAPWSEVRKHEVRQWLHWAIFNTDMDLENMDTKSREALERAVNLMEKRIGRAIPEGSNPRLRPFLLSLDKFNVYSRPFIVYVFIYLMNLMAETRLKRKYHLKFASFTGLEYCIRVPDAWDPNSDIRPIVFFHGLGLGISQYKMALTRIIRNFGDRPLLVVLQPHISQNIFHPNFLRPMNRAQTTDRLAALLHSLGWANVDLDIPPDSPKERIAAQKGVTMLSHSNGTYGHTWMLKDYPHMLTRSCFVDPVIFCSWEGDTCYNFLYRRCTTGIDLIMRYFVSTELGVANLMQRQFDWHSNALWPEEIPNVKDVTKTLFILGGKDTIVKAQRVKDYLISHGIGNSVYYDQNGLHGEPFILDGDSHNKILSWLRQG